MTWVAVATGVGAGLNYFGSQNAADAQRRAAQQAIDLQREQFNRIVDLNEPFRQAGLTGQNRLLSLLGLGGDQSSTDYGKYGKDFSMADFQQDPGYGFRLSEGLKSLDRQAAARGGLISGGALKAAQRYGQDLASNEYSNAYNRYQTNRSNQLNPLYNLIGTGQSAVGAIGNAGQNYANNAGDYYTQMGNVNSAGIIGGNNAINQGLSQYMNYGQQNSLINALKSYSGGYA